MHPRDRNKLDPFGISLDPSIVIAKDLINVVADSRVTDVEPISIKLLSPPPKNKTAEEQVEWASPKLYLLSFGRSFPRDGAKGYHGDNELVASNHLEIIHVETFDLVFNDDIEVCTEEFGEVIKEYYWRQTYDVRDGKLSEVPRYCACNKFFKPDLPLIECPACKKWLHQECILTPMLTKKWRETAVAEGVPIGRATAAPKEYKNYPFLDMERWEGFEIRAGERKSIIFITDTLKREEGAEQFSVTCLFEDCKAVFT